MALVKIAAMSMDVQISESLFALLLDTYPEVQLLDHMVILDYFF